MTTIDPGSYMSEELCFVLGEDSKAKFVFGAETDFSAVLIFGCSAQQHDSGKMMIDHMTSHMRAGKDHYHGGATGADHLEMLLRTKDHKILVIPNCCGQLAGMYRAALEDAYPETDWYFPDKVSDYGGSVSMHVELAEDLVKEGLLEIVKAKAA